ncbi:hypothetical protein CTAYLR_003027 [Chrysophaeum taylorii]|uniref:HSF-type DNA-binding domain-containing protein n=1 Tax=Chrysophaeum taylorii TaxID=2483200 RepID=A0AAD7U5X3_9STRA|nr:hypothetical protein CTAYLR_003027 [Chrysophaeum taylorii]
MSGTSDAHRKAEVAEDSLEKKRHRRRARKPKTIPFTTKLVSLFKNEPDLIKWDDGDIVITDPKLLEQKLSSYFRSGQYTSFQRQLNNFGFNKQDKASGPKNSRYIKVKGDAMGSYEDLLKLRPITPSKRRKWQEEEVMIDRVVELNRVGDVEKDESPSDDASAAAPDVQDDRPTFLMPAVQPEVDQPRRGRCDASNSNKPRPVVNLDDGQSLSVVTGGYQNTPRQATIYVVRRRLHVPSTNSAPSTAMPLEVSPPAECWVTSEEADAVAQPSSSPTIAPPSPPREYLITLGRDDTPKLSLSKDSFIPKELQQVMLTFRPQNDERAWKRCNKHDVRPPCECPRRTTDVVFHVLGANMQLPDLLLPLPAPIPSDEEDALYVPRKRRKRSRGKKTASPPAAQTSLVDDVEVWENVSRDAADAFSIDEITTLQHLLMGSEEEEEENAGDLRDRPFKMCDSWFARECEN